MKNRNELRFYLQTGLFGTAQMMINGAIVQSFMIESGIGESKVSALVSVMQIVQALTMLLCSKAVDRLKKIIRITALSQFVCILMPLILFVYSQFPQIDSKTKFLYLFLTGVAVSVPIGLYNVLTYKLPYSIIDIDRYGTVTAIGGLVLGICGMVMSVAMSFYLNREDYYEVMSVFFIVGIAMIVLAVVVTLKMTKVNALFETKTICERKQNLFSYRPFYQLIFPNIFRGLCAGVYVIMPTIGYYYGILDGASTGYLVVATNIATLISCYLYSCISSRMKRINGKMILIASIAISILLPAVLIGNSVRIFLAMYFAGYFFLNIVNYAIPTLITEIVDYKVMGQYSAWRMLLFTIGQAIASLVSVSLLELFSGAVILGGVGCFQLLCGIGYYLTEKQVNSKSEKRKE